jgi:hypothetical protein
MVLARAIILLQRLDPTGSKEYLRDCALALLTWSKFHDSLPGHVFVEEALEASLSRLHRQAGVDMRPENVTEFHHLYVGLGPADDRVRDLQSPGIAEIFSYRLRSRLQLLRGRCYDETLPFFSRPKKRQSTSRVQAQWPEGTPQRVQRLLVAADPSEFRAMLRGSLVTMLRPRTNREGSVDRARQAVREYCRDVPDLPTDVRDTRVQAAWAILNHCGGPRRPRPRQPSSESESDAAGVVSDDAVGRAPTFPPHETLRHLR